jgi:hypothetical protein
MSVATDRANANRDRYISLAANLRDAWRLGDKSWIDLAILAVTKLKPGSASADAVFTIELDGEHSSIHSQAPWGGDPADLLDRAISALQAERAALDGCPIHHAKGAGR